MDEEKPKWECEYCTYKNWEAAKKCTICHGSRPPKFITENHDQSPDIYQVASLVTSTDSTEGQPSCQKQTSDHTKWECSKCTYLNWARTRKCAGCYTKKTSSQSTILAAALEPLTINTSTASSSIEGNEAGYISNKTSPKSANTSNRTSPNSSGQAAANNRTSPGLVCSGAVNNDRNRNMYVNSLKNYQNKWNCKVCTYENWPKSVKCIICGILRSPSVRDLSLSPSLSPANQSSPPNSPRGAAASATPIYKPGKKVDNIHKFHDKFSELDWLWLKACIGICDEDRMAVDAYLACGGDVARQLTVEEASLLGDGNRFQKGHTLLHIALQSQREDVVTLLLTASVTSQTKKRLPPHTCPDLANEILRTVACSLRQRKGDFPCFFFTECVTYALPGGECDVIVILFVTIGTIGPQYRPNTWQS